MPTSLTRETQTPPIPYVNEPDAALNKNEPSLSPFFFGYVHEHVHVRTALSVAPAKPDILKGLLAQALIRLLQFAEAHRRGFYLSFATPSGDKIWMTLFYERAVARFDLTRGRFAR